MSLLTHHYIVDTRGVKCSVCGTFCDPMQTETFLVEDLVVCTKCKQDEQTHDDHSEDRWRDHEEWAREKEERDYDNHVRETAERC